MRYALIVILIYSFLSPATIAGTILKSCLIRMLHLTEGKIERIVYHDRVFTGYHSSPYKNFSWTKKIFEQVVTKEGIYSPVVRNYAKMTGLTLEESMKKMEYIKNAPPDLQRYFAIGHKWENLSESSPFISTAKRKSAASRHGPGAITSLNLGNAVLFSINRKMNSVMTTKMRGWEESWDLVQETIQASSRKTLSSINDSNQSRRLQIWDWLEKHNWMEEFSLAHDVELSPERLREFKVMSAKEKFQKNFNFFQKPSYGDITLMQWLETEELIFLHVIPESIEHAKLYDESGNVIQIYSR